MNNVKYIREFTCTLTGERTIIVNINGEEIALDYMDYIHNYYSEADHDAYQFKLETE